MFGITSRRPLRRMAIGMTAVLAGAAGAAAVSMTAASASPSPAEVRVFMGKPGHPIVWFTAGGGTVNQVEVNAVGGGYEITDSGGTVTLNPTQSGSCTTVDTHTVHCPDTPQPYLVVDLADGDDTFESHSNLDTRVSGDDGDDVFVGGSGSDTFLGQDGDDELNGANGADSLHGGSGNDTLNGSLSNDHLYGGQGTDTLRGGQGTDTLEGGPGEDELHGGADPDTLAGGAGEDELWGDGGDDTLSGDLGWTSSNDTVHGGTGADRLLPGQSGHFYGDGGEDVADYTGWSSGVKVSLDGNTNDRKLPECSGIGCPAVSLHNVHADVENVIGTSLGDKIFGNAAANEIDGGDGDDRLEGKAGDDYLDAEGGADQDVYGGPGTDTCVGYNITDFDCEA